jgi:hypothetical protein
MERKLMRLSRCFQQSNSFYLAKQLNVFTKSFHRKNFFGVRRTPLTVFLQRYEKIYTYKQLGSLSCIQPGRKQIFSISCPRKTSNFFLRRKAKRIYLKLITKTKKKILIAPHKSKKLLRKINFDQRFLTRCHQKIVKGNALLQRWERRLYPFIFARKLKCRKKKQGRRKKKGYLKHYLANLTFLKKNNKQNSGLFYKVFSRRKKLIQTTVKLSLCLNALDRKVHEVKGNLLRERRNRARKYSSYSTYQRLNYKYLNKYKYRPYKNKKWDVVYFKRPNKNYRKPQRLDNVAFQTWQSQYIFTRRTLRERRKQRVLKRKQRQLFRKNNTRTTTWRYFTVLTLGKSRR